MASLNSKDMKITVNNQFETLPAGISNIEQLVMYKKLPVDSTAVGRNGKIVMRRNWSTTMIDAGDNITLFSAAFGG